MFFERKSFTFLWITSQWSFEVQMNVFTITSMELFFPLIYHLAYLKISISLFQNNVALYFQTPCFKATRICSSLWQTIAVKTMYFSFSIVTSEAGNLSHSSCPFFLLSISKICECVPLGIGISNLCIFHRYILYLLW